MAQIIDLSNLSGSPDNSNVPTFENPTTFVVIGYDDDDLPPWSNQPSRFDRVRTWLDELGCGRIIINRNDASGRFIVIFEDEASAVQFGLTWSDHLID